ncbi:MAG: PAS domain-containing sensor histidine kinase, partial [Oceanidesulfovibrio sp.]
MTSQFPERDRHSSSGSTYWRPWFSFNLGLKILVPVLLACIVAAGLLVGLFSWQMSEQAYRDLQARLETFAESKAVELSEPVWNFREDMTAKLMQSYAHDEDLLEATLLDADGEVFITVRGARIPEYNRTFTASKELTHESRDKVYTLGRLDVVYHDGHIAPLLGRRLIENAVVITLLLLVLALSIWLAMHLLVGRPLMRLKKSLADNLRSTEMEPLQWSSNDEVGDVVVAYNDLLSEVDSQKKRLESMNEALRSEMEQRIKAEKDLQLAARIFDLSIEGLAITDDRGDIRRVNASFEKITGFSAAEVIGHNLREVKSGMGDADIHEIPWEQVKTEGHWTGDIWSRRKNGEPYAERLTLFRMEGDDGESSYQVAVFHEITERKLAEQALRRSRDDFESQVELRTVELLQANEKLIEMDRLRSAFLTSASHELRTPLTSVLGFVKLVKRDVARGVLESGCENQTTDGGNAAKAARILQNLEIVELEGARLTRLIDDLLDLNKIESGRMEWRDEPLDLGREAGRAMRAMAMSEGSQGLQFRQQIQDGLPQVRMDRDRFQQVMVNLLSNAIKFTNQGAITVSVAESYPGLVRVSIQDSGMGIPKEYQERIFERFFQGNCKDMDKPRGTGLGLAICR